MNRLFASIIAASVMTIAAGSASADTFRAEFRYDHAVSAEANYRVFEKTAAKACAINLERYASLILKRRAEAQCKTQTMADVVGSLENAALTMVHANRLGAAPQLALTNLSR